MRTDMERRFGVDFGAVRIHEGSTAPLRTPAYTLGADIVFASGRYAPGSFAGRHLLAHELAHVVQQRRAGGGPPVMGARSSRAEAEASAGAGTALTDARVPALSAQAAPAVQCAPEETDGWPSSSILDSVASAIVGPVQWGFIRAFLGGVSDGIHAQPAERYQRILARFELLNSLTGGWSEKRQYLKGLGLGIVEGFVESVTGLWHAVVFIVKLPSTIRHFLTTTLPDLAIRFASQLAGHSDLLEDLREKAVKALVELLTDPLAVARNLAGFLAGPEKADHGKVRELGRSAVEAVLGFLEEPWFEFGRDIGKIIGMVLFEVALALATDLIGSLVKRVGTWAARLSARAVAAGAELFRALGRLVGQAAEWLRNVARRIGGALGELWEKIAEVLRRFLGTLDDLAEAPELAGAGGPGMRLPASAIDEAKALTTLESRAVKGGRGGGRTTTTKVSELKPSPAAPKPPAAAEVPPAKTPVESAARAERAPQGGRARSLIELAEEAGVREQIEEGRIAVFMHGTEETTALRIVEDPAGVISATGGRHQGRFFTATDRRTIEEFARRTAGPGGRPGVVGMGLSEDALAQLRRRRLVITRPISDRPGLYETIFERGAIETLVREGFFFIVR